jgi:hypothetical protein
MIVIKFNFVPKNISYSYTHSYVNPPPLYQWKMSGSIPEYVITVRFLTTRQYNNIVNLYMIAMYIVFYLRSKMSNVLLRNDTKTCRRCCRIVLYYLLGALNKFCFCSKFVRAKLRLIYTRLTCNFITKAISTIFSSACALQYV